MEFTWKKMALIMTVVLGPFVLGMILLSNPMMDKYYERVKADPKNEKSDWIDHKWLLMTTADTCYKTMREEKSALYYYEYMRLYPEDKINRPHALLRYGHALNESNNNKDAIQVYLQFCEEYPDRTKDVESATAGIRHIRYIKP